MKKTSSLPSIITVGAAVRDIFVKSSAFETTRDPHAPDGYDACFPLGAKIAVDDLLLETGGGATNAAVTFARFGFHTSCIARVGKDESGDAIRTILEREGVHATHIQTDRKQPTSTSIILLAGSGFRTILSHRGPSSEIEIRDLPWNTATGTWVYLTSLGHNHDARATLFKQAKAKKAHIAWNPGNAELDLGLKKLAPHLIQTDILLLNRTEAAALADVAPRDLDSIIKRLSIYPRQALCITDGARGAYTISHGKVWYAPPLPAKRHNTTGAGDAFGSAFVAMAVHTGNMLEGLRAGMLNATGVVTKMGAKAGILRKAPTAAERRRVPVKTAAF